LVNLKNRPEDGAEQYQLLRIEVADGVPIERIAEQSLPADWREQPAVTQSLGNAWLTRQATALLAVPSVPSPESTNYLFNPRHAAAGTVEVAWHRWLRYDHRFFRLSE
jgi:RES domain-containing protein